ncbi:hypothetical protein RJ639_046153 [Escallonia herrerae]|uniref:Uncharacterized protein n=1 Tax=Escallonia herrerae TaxID=1293975 RepID=A0AA88W8K6_9ASTE|nr:hypothetical protein RJ639_046153 [Escallonia herrerae]
MNFQAWKCWRKETCLNLVDPIMKVDTSSMRDIVRCIHIGLLGVQEIAADRPSMAAVVAMLSSLSVTLPVPSKPAYFMRGSISPESESDSAGAESRSDGLNVQPIEDDLGRKKLVGEELSVEGEGTVDSSINDGDGGHHAKHIHDDTRLGDASSRLSRTRPPRLTFWKRFQSLFRGSASVNSVKRLSEDSRQGELEFKNEVLHWWFLERRGGEAVKWQPWHCDLRLC